MSEEGSGWYAGYEIGLAINRLKNRKQGPELSPAEVRAKAVFDVVAGPISALEGGLSGENQAQSLVIFLKDLSEWRKPILDSKTDLDLVAPKISSNLFDLFSRLDKATQGKWKVTFSSDEILNDSTFPSLVSWLRYDINQWITEHS